MGSSAQAGLRARGTQGQWLEHCGARSQGLLQPCQLLTVVWLQLLYLQVPKEKHIEIIQTK